LDDVFVNFDAGRTKTACAVLRDFAKQGHQLLVFTCHEHVWKMFQELKVDTRRIPNRFGEQESEEPPAESVDVPEPVVGLAPEPILPPVEFEPPPVPVMAVPEAIHDGVLEVVDDPVEILQEPAPAFMEVEYWWDSAPPRASNGRRNDDTETSSDWMPEPVIHPQPW
jgi:hypothetical protein